MGFTLSTGQHSQTLVPDYFIKNHMLSSDGNFVKVYLFILMLSQRHTSDENYSVSDLADQMECTEKDICRALRYWQKEGLLDLELSGNEIHRITLKTPDASVLSAQTEYAAATPVAAPKMSIAPEAVITDKAENLPPASANKTDISLPAKQFYTPMQAEAFRKDTEINRAIDKIEQLLGEPVTQAHLQTILYFMCDIGFSAELIIKLYDTAVKKGKKKPNYIEAIGISWASQGIQTPEEAEDESLHFSGRYRIVSNAFGIQGNLKPAQREIVDSWNVYQFADSIIAEACKRTVLQTGDANFQYASKILENWHSKQVISLKDIEKCDESYKKQKKNAGTATTGISSRGISSKKNQFQNFPQREYSKKDYDSLEKKLLQGQSN